ncbi:MAG: hypothetical protein OXI94_02945 [Gemmatimonadota bacterium]|nr:hypothetical protein [Gemmatimonadota bacterium]MDE2831517.1 hypothetical protein [Gemmatimonadota bacterium]
MNERPLWLILEDAFIILCIGALWPGILGWQGWIWDMVQYIALIGLVWILIRRIGRYRMRRDEGDDN